MDALSSFYNNTIDVLVASSRRFLELPLIFVVPIAALSFFILAAIVQWIRRRRGATAPVGATFRTTLVLTAILAALFVIDKKFTMVLSELRGLRGLKGMVVESLRRPALAGGREALPPALRRPLLFDAERVQKGLEERYKDVEMVASVDSEAVDHAAISMRCPNEARFHVAVVDLAYPGLEICITPTFGEKILTTDFARSNGCVVAVNGEAGESPAADSGLGQWTGNWVARGQAVLLEDSALRPFMSFDKSNRGRYSKAEIVDRTLTDDKWNTIWGRFDLVVDGVPVLSDRHHVPRTCMGLNKAGDRVVLLVADGRQPGYSLGLNFEELATVMKLFGAENAMSCDQGGSSSMYLTSVGGIVNVPSDQVGERPTYSHFGVRIKK